MSILSDFKFKREQQERFKLAGATLVRTIQGLNDVVQTETKKIEALTGLYENPTSQSFRDEYERLSYGVRFNYFDKDEISSRIAYSHRRIAETQDIIRLKFNNLDFIRPHTSKDLAEREEILKTFANKVQTIDRNDELCLRFKGIPIGDATDVFNTQQITSSTTRIGHQTTAAKKGTIAVSTIDKLQYTVADFAGISPDRQRDCLPGGVIFVMQPQSQEEAEMAKDFQMEELFFDKSPEKIVAVITTNENMKLLKMWLTESDLSPDLAHSYSEFPTFLENNFQEIKNGLNFNYDASKITQPTINFECNYNDYKNDAPENGER